MKRRVDIKAILANPVTRRELIVPTIVAIQATAGIETTRAQAEEAYENVRLRSRLPDDVKS